MLTYLTHSYTGHRTRTLGCCSTRSSSSIRCSCVKSISWASLACRWSSLTRAYMCSCMLYNIYKYIYICYIMYMYTRTYICIYTCLCMLYIYIYIYKYICAYVCLRMIYIYRARCKLECVLISGTLQLCSHQNVFSLSTVGADRSTCRRARAECVLTRMCSH